MMVLTQVGLTLTANLKKQVFRFLTLPNPYTRSIGLSPTIVGKIYRNQFNQIDNYPVTTLCLYFGLKSISTIGAIVGQKSA